MKEADDDFFWFITFLTDEGDSTQPSIRAALELPPAPQTTRNLWCCRRCGAMVHGGQRHTHKSFHQRLRAAGIE